MKSRLNRHSVVEVMHLSTRTPPCLSLSCARRMVRHIAVGIDTCVPFYVMVWGILHVKRCSEKLSLFWAKFCVWRNRSVIVTRARRSQTCFDRDPAACSQAISWKRQREEESKGRSSMIDKREDLACLLLGGSSWVLKRSAVVTRAHREASRHSVEPATCSTLKSDNKKRKAKEEAWCSMNWQR